jgi:predicted phosphoribosyltransferase
VPTAAGSAYRELRPEVDELVALMRPEPFYGVFCLRSFFATESAFLAVVFGSIS